MKSLTSLWNRWRYKTMEILDMEAQYVEHIWWLKTAWSREWQAYSKRLEAIKQEPNPLIKSIRYSILCTEVKEKKG